MKSIQLTALSALLSTAIAGNVMAESNHNAVYSLKENPVLQQLKQVDGYYRVMVGDYEVTALYDGYLSIGTPAYQEFTKLSKADLDALISG